MKFEDIHVGDRLRIRQWDDMEEEFGVNLGLKSIRCKFGFTWKMACLCGLPYTVSAVDAEVGIMSEEGTERIGRESGGVWHISAEMLEPATEPDSIDMPEEDLFGFLIG